MMKQSRHFSLYILVLLLLTTWNMHELAAQVPIGSMVLGGDISGSYSKTVIDSSLENRYLSATFSPRFGIFVAPNFVLGLQPLISTSSSHQFFDIDREYDTETLQLGLDIYGKYYIGTSDWKPFVSLGIGIFHSASSNEWTDPYQVAVETYRTEYVNWHIGGNLTTGVAWFIREYMSMGISLTYRNTMGEYSSDSPNDSYSESRATSGLSLGLGFNYFFIR